MTKSKYKIVVLINKFNTRENQVAWASVAMSSFQGRIWGILDSIPRKNNVRMSLRMSQISRPPLVGQKPV